MNFIKRIIEQRKLKRLAAAFICEKYHKETGASRYIVAVQWYDTGHITSEDAYATTKEAAWRQVQQYLLGVKNKKLNVDYGIVNVFRASEP